LPVKSSALLRYLPYLLLASLMVLLALLPEHWQLLLRYNRSDLVSGHYWQLVTGHLLHSNYWHLLMNLGGLMLAMLLHARYFTWHQLLWQWLLSAVLISTCLYTFTADMQSYVGLSGLLHAMLIQGAVKDIQHRQSGGWLLAGGLVAKVLWEQWHGPDPQLAQLIDASVATDAHLYGVLAGLSITLLVLLAETLRK
jgi:rhomboid family GlyGly-CTERM serine protease